jgi:alkylation response protein AidB-like acyl-CoA dehydrogenase
MSDRSGLVSRAEALRPLLSSNAAQGAAERRLTDTGINALAEAGLFKVTLPERYGGHEAGIRTLLEVAAAVAHGDGAAGWVVSLTNICGWIVALSPGRTQDEVFGADPEARVCGSVAPAGSGVAAEGGVRLSGRWSYVSGSLHAQWALLGFNLVDGNGEIVEGRIALVPAKDYAVSDTWFMAGMRATGSNTVTAQDVFVPAHRVLSRTRLAEGDYPTEYEDEVSYRSAWSPMLRMALLGPVLGMGRAALDHVRDAAGTKGMFGTVFTRQADSAGFQMQLAEAALRIDTAHMHARRAADDIEEYAARGEQPAFPARARMRADSSLAASQVVEAINMLLNVHGSAGFADASALQRIWQDANVAARHASLLPGISYEVYGKALLGVTNDVATTV